MKQLVEFTMLSRSCAAVSRLVGTLRRSIGLNRAVAAVIRFTTEFAERFRREHKVVSINNLLCSLCGFSASSAVKTASNAFLKRAALAAVILLLGAAAVLAQTSSNGWTFSVKGDGTASLGKPVDEVWEYNPQLWEEWNDGSKEWVWYGGMQFKGYTDHIASTLLLPSSVTTQTVTWDSDSHSYVRNYGATYTVTETGSGLTTAQRTALISVSIPSSISVITTYAFMDCSLMSITIPSTVTTIGNGAFMRSSLPSVTVPATVTSMGGNVFINCTALQSATILNNTIAGAQFSGCTSLKDVTISSNVTSIGGGAFYNCPSVETLTVPASVTTISTGPSSSFEGLTGLKTLNFYAKAVPCCNFGSLPIENMDLTGVESIAAYAFLNCAKLRTVVLTNSLTAIDNFAFSGNSSLVSVTVPATVTNMGADVFINCTGLQSATILNSAIAPGQFSNCTSLKDVTISSNVTSIGGSAFYNCPSVETLTVPASVTTIGSSAFSGLTGLKTLNFYAKTVPGSNFGSLPIENMDLTGVESIAAYAFLNCAKLKTVVLTNSLRIIGYEAFCGCKLLQQITLPSSINSIDAAAFVNCTGLQQVTARWQMPFAVGSAVFSGVNTHAVRLNTPEGRENAYRAAAVWKDFLIETKLLSYTPAVLGSEGGASITIYGGYLTGDATVELIQNGSVLKAVSVTAGGMGECIAAFEPGQLPAGTYDLHIAQAGSVDTLITNGISVQTTVYPTVVSNIESQNNLVLRTGFSSTSYLVLHNTGNIDALGVNAHLFVPEGTKVEIDRKNFRQAIDTTQTLNLYCSDFDVALTIPNSVIANYMDLIMGDSIPVTEAFEAPYRGTAYQIYVPKIPAGGTAMIPVKITSSASPGNTLQLISAVEATNTFNPVTADSLNRFEVQRLNNFVDAFIGIQDSAVFQNITDFAVWQKTWKVAEDIARQVIAADRDRIGYSAAYQDNIAYDGAIYQKEAATVILALKALAERHSSEQRADGIINFASIYQTASAPAASKAKSYSKVTPLEIINSDWFQAIMEKNPTYSELKNYGEAFIDLYRMMYVDNQDPSRHGLRFFTTLTPDEQQRLVKIWYARWGESMVWDQVDKIVGISTYGPLITPILKAGVMTLQAGFIVADKIRQNYIDAGLEDIAPEGAQGLLDRIFNRKKQQLTIRKSYDPNSITGTAGVGAEQYITASQPMSYVVNFENMPDADVPAMFVNVYDTLDVSKYDMKSFKFGAIQVADTTLAMPAVFNGSYYNEYDMRPRQNYLIGVTAELDTVQGIAHWRFETLDPATHATIDDIFGGFLPPNVNAPEGEASVSFSVKQKDNLPNRTQLANEATIFFDYNDPMTTNLWTNTLDIASPQSAVSAVQLSDSTFKVMWNGSDAESGMNYYAVYVSVNNGSFFPLGSYSGVNEMTVLASVDTLYSFYVTSTDNVGNAEQKMPVAEASIQLAKTGVVTNVNNAQTLHATSLRAWVTDGALHVSGLTAGEPWRVYNVTGVSLPPTPSEGGGVATMPLPGHGVYIVKQGNRKAKAVW